VRAPTVEGDDGPRVEVLALPAEHGDESARVAPHAPDEHGGESAAVGTSAASEGAALAARVDLAARLRAAVERRGRKWRRLGQHQAEANKLT
jgi:hypothetical protein